MVFSSEVFIMLNTIMALWRCCEANCPFIIIAIQILEYCKAIYSVLDFEKDFCLM